jgi:hypothetical protein
MMDCLADGVIRSSAYSLVFRWETVLVTELHPPSDAKSKIWHNRADA